jgi:hypothetical protein
MAKVAAAKMVAPRARRAKVAVMPVSLNGGVRKCAERSFYGMMVDKNQAPLKRN